MEKFELLALLRKQKWAVACTSSALGAPESALVGVAFTQEFEIVFDTARESRKVVNIQRDSGISFVIGGWFDGDEQTVQYEGLQTSRRVKRFAWSRLRTLPSSRKVENVRASLAPCTLEPSLPGFATATSMGRRLLSKSSRSAVQRDLEYSH